MGRLPTAEDNSDNQHLLDSLNNIIRLNEIEAQRKIQELNDQNKILEDSLAKWPKTVEIVNPPIDTTKNVVTPPIIDNDIKSNSEDHFIELSGKDTPNGYYVITGAFAEKSNADALIRKIKGKFPNARIILNKRNNLYYVLLYHSTEKGEGLAYASYKAKEGLVEETWILEYNRKP